MSKMLISKLVKRYGFPKTPDPEFMISELEALTSSYGNELASKAYDIIVANNGRGFFPVEKEILDGLKAAHAETYRERTPNTADNSGSWSTRAQSDANRLINSDLGRRAADENWIGRLWDFCRENRRLPNPTEQGRLIIAHKQLEADWAAYAQQDRQLAGLVQRCMVGLEVRRQRLREVAYGKTAGQVEAAE